jgi:nicotinamidase-related amidase
MSLGRWIVLTGVFMLAATQATAQDLRELRIETFIYADGVRSGQQGLQAL